MLQVLSLVMRIHVYPLLLLVLLNPLSTADQLFQPVLVPAKSEIHVSINELNPALEPLILTNLLDKPDQAKKLSEVSHPAFQAVKSYSGYFKVDSELDSNLFFWFFPSAVDRLNAPLILWIQGGFGTSCLYGIFKENGPFNVDQNGNVSLREYSWHTYHNMLYIDSPVGTGFSFTSGPLVNNINQSSTHLYDALRQFFGAFPEFRKNDFFIAGESLAGRYAPELAYVIHQKNEELSEDERMNLKGLLLGSAWFDPENMCVWSEYLLNLGFLDRSAYEEMRNRERDVIKHIKANNFEKAREGIADLIYGNESFFYTVTGLTNVYNYMLDKVDDEISYIDKFITDPAVLTAIHVRPASFSIQQDSVYSNLSDEMVKSSAPTIEKLLKLYKILFYNGQFDVVVGYPITLNAIDHLNFDGYDEYVENDRCSWYVDERIAGFTKTGGLLTEVMIRNASHMVTLEQPKAAYDLMYRFVRNLTLCETYIYD